MLSVKNRRTVFVLVEKVGPDIFVIGRLNGQGRVRYIRVGAILQAVPGFGLCVELELEKVEGVVATVRFGNGEWAEVLDWRESGDGLRIAG